MNTKISINISSTTYGEEEKAAVNRVMDSNWLGIGKESKQFEESMAAYIGVKHAMFVNSGSSALLLGLKSLNLPAGSEVITCAAGFPSTLSPIIHLGLKPVVVDCELDTMNIDPLQAKRALSDKTSAIVFAHAAGNPCNMNELQPILDRIPSVEDACDTLGATYNGRKIGSFGSVSALSFFASHHITAAGGGGMVLTNSDELIIEMFSLRDWGKRYKGPGYYQRNFSAYDTDVDGVPYDLSYTYDTVGFNMKLIEVGAAFANEQFKRLPSFIEIRNNNYNYFYNYFFKERTYQKYFVPTRVYDNHTPSWFFFVFILKDGISFTRKEFATYLEDNGIHTRPFFAGNIVRQPALFGNKVKVFGELTNSNKLMENAVMIGVHPKIGETERKHIVQTVDAFLEDK